MKKCPSCQKVYEDDSLRFCLECGAMLVSFTPNEPPATMQMPFPRDTQGGGQFGQTPSNFGVSPNAPNWQTAPANNVAQPAKKGGFGCLYWIIGLVAVSIILGVIAIVGFGILVANLPDDDNTNSSNINKPTPTTPKTGNTKTPFDSPPTSGNLRVKTDFSKWRTGSDAYATKTYTGGEYQVTSSRDGYYYVLLAAGEYSPGKGYSTSRAVTKMTVRSVTGTSPALGYGVVIHSDPKPLKRGYAFLIRTGTSPSFRVVQHTDSDEKALVDWTKMNAIRTGTSPNELEVRADGSKLDFYINGQFATSITDQISDGITGIYTSDTTPISFNKLEIYNNE